MIWFIIGIALLIWVIYDLLKAEVWGFRQIRRYEEPLRYWLWLALYFILALSCILPYVLWYV